MIVVFGATGTIGGQVLRHLQEQGADVRAVARTQEKADALGGVVADLADPSTLPAAVAGADHVFVATTASADQTQIESNLVDALAGTGTHLVKLAAMGYDAVPPDQAIALSASHARVVAYAKEKGVPLTVLAPSGFMTNLLASAATIQQGQLYASAGDGGLAWVDPADIGAVAAHVLTSSGHEGASYDITGPEVLNHGQVAGLLTEVLGHEVAYVDVPPEQFTGSLRSAGLDPWLADALGELNQLYRQHLAEATTDEVQKATGRPARSLRDWLVEHRASFAG